MTTLHRQSQHPSLPSPEAYSKAVDQRADLDAKPDAMPTDWPSRLIIAGCLVLSFFVAFCAYKLFH